MLHIKLSKGKTKRALMARAKWYYDRAEAATAAYHAEIETWRKLGTHDPRRAFSEGPPAYIHNGMSYTAKAMGLVAQADACAHSTGDVYVSVETWNEIEGYYDA